MIRIVLKEGFATKQSSSGELSNALGSIQKTKAPDKDIEMAAKKNSNLVIEDEKQFLELSKKINSSNFKMIIPALIKFIKQDQDKTTTFTSIVKYINGFEKQILEKGNQDNSSSNNTTTPEKSTNTQSNSNTNGGEQRGLIKEGIWGNTVQWIKAKFVDFNSKITKLFSNKGIQVIALAALLYNLYDNMSGSTSGITATGNIDVKKLEVIFKLIGKLSLSILSGTIPNKDIIGEITSEMTELLFNSVMEESKGQQKLSLKEVLSNHRKHYVVIIQFSAEPDTKVYGSLYNELRAIPGVTVIKAAAKVKAGPNEDKIFTMRVKFLCQTTLVPEYLKLLEDRIKSLTDPNGNGIISCKVSTAPREVGKKSQHKHGGPKLGKLTKGDAQDS